ncbi:MAG: T9SS type A sorting domain-containing protein [Candidatus Latescibacterota bacterium]
MLWARAKVRSLEAWLERHGIHAEVLAAMEEIGYDYGVATPATPLFRRGGRGAALLEVGPWPPASGPAETTVVRAVGEAQDSGRAPAAGRLLLRIYPNPANAATTLTVRVPAGPSGQRSILTLYDLLGQAVRSWTVPATGQEQRLVWDGRDEAGRPAGSGVYIARLQGPDVALAGRLLLLR